MRIKWRIYYKSSLINIGLKNSEIVGTLHNQLSYLIEGSKATFKGTTGNKNDCV